MSPAVAGPTGSEGRVGLSAAFSSVGGTAPLGDPTSTTVSLFTVISAIAGARTEVARTKDATAIAGADPAVLPIPAGFAAAVAVAGAEAVGAFLSAMAANVAN